MSKTTIRRLMLTITLLGLIGAACWFALNVGGNPVAIVRVVDAGGKPVAGAIVVPEGLRTKNGPYRSGWYGWPSDTGVSNPPVRTRDDGTATIPYPRYVFERIETGVICLDVNHPDFVADRPECDVDTTPPAGAPAAVLLKYYWDRIKTRSLIAQTAPIVLKKGAILHVSLREDSAGPPNATLFAQVNSVRATDSNSWFRPDPNQLITRRLAPGPFMLRAIKVETNGTTWFSEVVSNTAVAGRTNSFEFALHPGVTVHGELDAIVPRPVRNGRVIAEVWPAGVKGEASPPHWHSWAKVGADGTFEIASLPAGDLEIVALCDGFISTNGPGSTGMRYPQKHLLETNDVSVVIGMEPTARLEVMVTDEKGQPLKDAKVMTWPNVRYGEWFATIFASDCYKSADLFSHPLDLKKRDRSVPDFEGVSDSNGVAVLANLPPDVKEFAVQHARYALPAITMPGWSRKERYAPISLIAGETNRTSVQLQLLKESPIAHY